MVCFNKGNWTRDAITSKTWLQLFKKYFSERKLFSSHGNILNFDLGKLVIPRVFMDSDLLIAISQNYDPVARIVRIIDGECLMKITIEEIHEFFGKEPTTYYHEVIDF